MSAGHRFAERRNQNLEDAGFDAFIEGLCVAFYASRQGRRSRAPGAVHLPAVQRLLRKTLIGARDSVVGGRFAESAGLPNSDVARTAPCRSLLPRTRLLVQLDTNLARFTWMLERMPDAVPVRGKMVGIDSTTLESNAAMRSIERRDTGDSHEALVRRLAERSGWRHRMRVDVARFDRSRQGKIREQRVPVSSGREDREDDGRPDAPGPTWPSTTVALDTRAIVSVTVHDVSDGDTVTLPDTLIDATMLRHVFWFFTPLR